MGKRKERSLVELYKQPVKMSRPLLKEQALEPASAPLDDDDDVEAYVEGALKGVNSRKPVIHENSNIQITGKLLQCLLPDKWLDGDVINLYLALLKEREKRKGECLKCLFFNTYFYDKLRKPKTRDECNDVEKWTMQNDIGYRLIDYDKIFVPIHVINHWCLAIIDKKAKKFQYLDSCRGRNSYALSTLSEFFEAKASEANEDLDVNCWKREFVEDLPQQENGSDCGMFMIMYANFLSQGLTLSFSQEGRRRDCTTESEMNFFYVEMRGDTYWFVDVAFNTCGLDSF